MRPARTTSARSRPGPSSRPPRPLPQRSPPVRRSSSRERQSPMPRDTATFRLPSGHVASSGSSNTSPLATPSPEQLPGTVRLADYVANALADHGIRDVFLVTGGGAMHLNDAIGRCERLHYMACHHEQACTIAAQGYYRLSNRLAAVNVTTGPGGTNAITGVYGAWVDSLGMVVVSGQVKWETLVRSTGLPLRQLGDQEVDIVRLVESITKYAVMVTDPATIRYHLEKAIHLARTGRPGPVWIDIPMNVQAASVEPELLVGYDAAAESPRTTTASLDDACAQLIERIRAS